MVVPDLALICEIMLMAEGFQNSKMLSRKFVILYKLCEDLLSKSRHYDWKLRAIKTTLYVAGSMKRAAPELSEDKVGCQPLAFDGLGCRRGVGWSVGCLVGWTVMVAVGSVLVLLGSAVGCWSCCCVAVSGSLVESQKARQDRGTITAIMARPRPAPRRCCCAPCATSTWAS